MPNHPYTGNSIVGGGSSVVSSDPFDYYLGSSLLPYMIAAENADTNFAGVQSQTGLGLLGALSQFLGNPTGGPLGLMAAARYGGPQGIASKTGGKGIETPYESGLYEKLLESLAGFSTGINAKPEDAKFLGGPAQANNPAIPATQPGVSTNAGASAPFVWSDYLAGNQGGSTPSRDLLKTAGLLRAKHGGMVKLQNYTDGGTHLLPAPPATPTPTPTPKVSGPTDEQLNAYGGRQLIEAAKKVAENGGDVEGFVNQLKNVAALRPLLAAGSIRLPEFGTQQPQLDQLLPEMIRRLLEQNFATLPYPTLAQPQAPGYNMVRPGFEDGGGMTLGGAPHYIVDAKGKPVAALTEDGKPEEVKGVGGVEVVPLDPMRNALYESRKKQADMGRAIADAEENLKPTQKIDPTRVPMMTPEDATKTPNTVPTEMARLQVGGYQMLPEQWTGGGTAGPVKLPTQGGPMESRKEQIGNRESVDAITAGPAPIPGTPEYKAQQAKLLGARLSDTGSQAVNVDIVKSLNQGKAPNKLISQSAFSTMGLDSQSAYIDTLLKMGIIQSPEQLFQEQRRFAPTALR